jgi:predicted dehydrogenase
MQYEFVQWGMIGVGNFSQKKSAPFFNKIAQSALVAVGSRTPENARQFAFENEIRKCYDDPLQVIGDPVAVTGKVSNLAGIYEPEDTVTALIQLPGDLLLSGNWSFVVPEVYQRDRVCVTGENGTLSFSIFSFEPIRLEMMGEVSMISVEQPEHIQMPFIQTIVDELTGKGLCPSTGITAAVTSRAMDEILC